MGTLGAAILQQVNTVLPGNHTEVSLRVIRRVPAHARKFSINHNVPLIQMEHILGLAKFEEDWVSFDDR